MGECCFVLWELRLVDSTASSRVVRPVTSVSWCYLFIFIFKSLINMLFKYHQLDSDETNALKREVNLARPRVHQREQKKSQTKLNKRNRNNVTICWSKLFNIDEINNNFLVSEIELLHLLGASASSTSNTTSRWSSASDWGDSVCRAGEI